MEKEITFDAKHVRHINWDKLITEMLDAWLSVKIVKNPDNGEIVVKAGEENGL